MANKSREFLIRLKKPFLDIRWAQVRSKDALLKTLDGHSSEVISVAITSDNSKIVSGSDDDTIKIWDLNTGKLLNTFRGHSDSVHSVAITTDNRKIVSGSADQSIKIWNLHTGELLNTLEDHTHYFNLNLKTGKLLNTLEGHSDRIHSVAITPDNTKIVSGSEDNTIKVWDLHAGNCYLSKGFDIVISSIALSKHGNLITLGDKDGNLYVGNLYA